MNPKGERARGEREIRNKGPERERGTKGATREEEWARPCGGMELDMRMIEREGGDGGEEKGESKIENGRAILTGSLIVGRSGLSARTRAGSVGPPRSISAAQHSPLSPTSENEASLTRVSADDAVDLFAPQPRQVSLNRDPWRYDSRNRGGFYRDVVSPQINLNVVDFLLWISFLLVMKRSPAISNYMQFCHHRCNIISLKYHNINPHR